MSETPKCHRCGTLCYKGEERLALDAKSWHIQCFTCAACNASLDTRSLAECREQNEIFCWNCYRKYFATAGYGFGSKPTLVTQDRPIQKDCYDTTPGPSEVSVRPQPKPVEQQAFIPVPSRLGQQYITYNPPPRFYTNQAIVSRQVYRKCSPVAHPPTQAVRSARSFSPQRKPPGRCAGPSRSPGPPNPTRIAPRPTTARPATAREYCFRCGREVFNGPERALGYRGVYHKSCFVCYSCNKSLDPRTVNEDCGNLYCKGCYNRLVGPTGVGFGVGAGVLQTR